MKIDTAKSDRQLEDRYLRSNAGVARLLQSYPSLRQRAVVTGNYGYTDLAVDMETAWAAVPPFYRHILYELFVYGTDADTLIDEMQIPQPAMYAFINEGVNRLRDDLNGYDVVFLPQEAVLSA